MDAITRRGASAGQSQEADAGAHTSGLVGRKVEVVHTEADAAAAQTSAGAVAALQSRQPEVAEPARMLAVSAHQRQLEPEHVGQDDSYAELGLSPGQIQRCRDAKITVGTVESLFEMGVPIECWFDIQERIGTKTLGSFAYEFYAADAAHREAMLRAYGPAGDGYGQWGFDREETTDLMAVGVTLEQAGKFLDADVSCAEALALFAIQGMTADMVLNIKAQHPDLRRMAEQLEDLSPADRTAHLRAFGPEAQPYLAAGFTRQQSYDFMLLNISDEEAGQFKALGFDVADTIEYRAAGNTLAQARSEAHEIFLALGLSAARIRLFEDAHIRAAAVKTLVGAGVPVDQVAALHARVQADKLDQFVEEFVDFDRESKAILLRAYNVEGDAYLLLGYDRTDAAAFIRDGVSPGAALEREYLRLGLPLGSALTALAAVPTGPLTRLGSGKFNTVYSGPYSWAGAHPEMTIFKPLQPPDARRSKLVDRSWVGPRTGIDVYDPKFAQRNLVAAAVQKLGQRVVPAGSGIVLPSIYPKTGLGLRGTDPEMGLVMEFAKGVSPSRLRARTLRAPEFCRQAMWLQVWDQVLGQGDRHRNNYLVEVDARGALRLIGVDNDQCGCTVGDPRELAYRADKSGEGFKGVGLPPLIDTEMALVLERLNTEEFSAIFTELLPDDPRAGTATIAFTTTASTARLASTAGAAAGLTGGTPTAAAAAGSGPQETAQTRAGQTSPSSAAAQAAISRLRILQSHVVELRKSGMVIEPSEWGSTKAMAALADGTTSYVGREWAAAATREAR